MIRSGARPAWRRGRLKYSDDDIISLTISCLAGTGLPAGNILLLRYREYTKSTPPAFALPDNGADLSYNHEMSAAALAKLAGTEGRPAEVAASGLEKNSAEETPVIRLAAVFGRGLAAIPAIVEGPRPQAP